MPLPEKTKLKYLERFEELIREGESIKTTKSLYGGHLVNGKRRGAEEIVDLERYCTWKAKVTTLLDNVIPESSAHHKRIVDIRKKR